MATKFYRSRTDVTKYEPFLAADGTQIGEVAWLRQADSQSKRPLAGMWRCEASKFPYPFGLHETFVMTKGVLRVELEDGSTEEYRPGDTASYVMGTQSNWTVVEPVEHFFVVND
jgi:uncharacterized cupin superfamily protein